MSRERTFKNTFAPSCRDRELRVSDIVTGMRFGVFKYRHLPPEARDAVDKEIKRMREEAQREEATGDWKLDMLDLGMEARQEKIPGPGSIRDMAPVADFQRQALPVQIPAWALAHDQIKPIEVGFNQCLRVKNHA